MGALNMIVQRTLVSKNQDRSNQCAELWILDLITSESFLHEICRNGQLPFPSQYHHGFDNENMKKRFRIFVG